MLKRSARRRCLDFEKQKWRSKATETDDLHHVQPAVWGGEVPAAHSSPHSAACSATPEHGLQKPFGGLQKPFGRP